MAINTPRDLIDILSELQHRFTHHGGTVEGNILERYFYFIRNSEHGKRCSYAIKSRELFIRHDFEECMKLVLEAADLYRETMDAKPPELFTDFPPHGDDDAN